MLCFLLIVGLLIFVPGVVLFIGAAALAIVITFLVFFLVWGGVAYVAIAAWPNAIFFSVAVSFVAGIVAAGMVIITAYHKLSEWRN